MCDFSVIASFVVPRGARGVGLHPNILKEADTVVRPTPPAHRCRWDTQKASPVLYKEKEQVNVADEQVRFAHYLRVFLVLARAGIDAGVLAMCLRRYGW